jgi:predicted CopG family antitoxin
MTTEDPKPREGKGGAKRTLQEDVGEALNEMKSGDARVISTTVEKLLLKKKDELPPVENLIGVVKNSGIIEVFDEKIKRKYKLK